MGGHMEIIPNSQQTLFEGLHPLVKDGVVKVLAKLDEVGSPCVLESGFRSFEKQENLYQLGRIIKNPDGISPSQPMGNIVTWAHAEESLHNYGLAVDITRLDKNFHKTWELPYKIIGDIGKEFGFEYGGDWAGKKCDPDHLQMTFGYTLSQIQELCRAVGLKGLWDRIDQKDWV